MTTRPRPHEDESPNLRPHVQPRVDEDLGGGGLNSDAFYSAGPAPGSTPTAPPNMDPAGGFSTSQPEPQPIPTTASSADPNLMAVLQAIMNVQGQMAQQQFAFAQQSQAMMQQHAAAQHEMQLRAAERDERFMSQIAKQTESIAAMVAKQKATGQRKGDPPKFAGDAGEDVDMWIFSTQTYYKDSFKDEMESQFSGNFVEMISSNLGSNAMTWFRELSTTFADRPITWDLFKVKLCERFKDKDHAYKTLTKMFDLRYKSCASQEDYASKYQTYLSTLEVDLPDIVKRWFFQRGLRADCNSHVTTQQPETYAEAVAIAQAFHNANPDKHPDRKPTDDKSALMQKPSSHKSRQAKADHLANITCTACKQKGHYAPNCPDRHGYGKGGSGAPTKN